MRGEIINLMESHNISEEEAKTLYEEMHKELLVKQTFLTRILLKIGIDISDIADRFSYEQLILIIEGVEEGVNITDLLNPEMDVEDMRGFLHHP